MLLIGQIYLESPQQTGNVDWLEHSMHINTTAIRGQIGQVQALKPARAGTVLVQEIRDFLWEVAENLQASKAGHGGSGPGRSALPGRAWPLTVQVAATVTVAVPL